MKRTYVLIVIAALQLIVGLVTVYGAAAPVHTSQDVFIPSGSYHHYEFGILGAGQLSGNVSESLSRPFDFLVFDDRGYASFLDGSSAVPPIFAQNGTSVVFSVDLAGGQYHVVVVDLPARGELRVHLSLTAVGLKTSETILAVIVLVGGMSLIGASLMISVWSSRRGPRAPDRPDPKPADSPKDSSDDTRIY